LIVAFIDDQRGSGHTVESVCRVLREQGLQIAARTYRAWRTANRSVAERTVSDAAVIDAVRDIAWTRNPRGERKRAGDLLDRDFTAPAPNRVWVTDFAYVRSWAGWVYVAFILDVHARRIVAWHASMSKVTELVMTPLRTTLW
jgi:transposase InsO family protein